MQFLCADETGYRNLVRLVSDFYLSESGRGEPIAIDRAAFPLPRLGPKLLTIRDELINGRGFALLRGLPLESLSQREAAIMYWGLGTHIGKAVSQNGPRLEA